MGIFFHYKLSRPHRCKLHSSSTDCGCDEDNGLADFLLGLTVRIVLLFVAAAHLTCVDCDNRADLFLWRVLVKALVKGQIEPCSPGNFSNLAVQDAGFFHGLVSVPDYGLRNAVPGGLRLTIALNWYRRLGNHFQSSRRCCQPCESERSSWWRAIMQRSQCA
jgi:hypothetical protein